MRVRLQALEQQAETNNMGLLQAQKEVAEVRAQMDGLMQMAVGCEKQIQMVGQDRDWWRSRALEQVAVGDVLGRRRRIWLI